MGLRSMNYTPLPQLHGHTSSERTLHAFIVPRRILTYKAWHVCGPDEISVAILS